MNTEHILNPLPLAGRLALVTGGGQGIGARLARGFAAAGAKVIVTDMNAETVGGVVAGIEREGGQAWAFVLDVTDVAACDALAKRVVAEIGTVDLLLNNAGIIIREGSDSPRAASNWHKTMDVNVNGTFNVTQAFLPGIRERRGTILNLGSIAAWAGQGGSLGYSPAKAAIVLYTQSLAAELAKDGVRVNALAPGVFVTPINDYMKTNPERVQGFMNRIPMGRLGQTDDLVGPAIFLSSAMSSYITGVTLPVDGGFLAV